MDSPHRLKMKIGPHEFEAEGTDKFVQKQFEAFKELVSGFPPTAPAQQIQSAPARGETVPQASNATSNGKRLSKIMRVEDRVVSLTVHPGNIYEAIMLLLYGQKELRQNESVTGAEVMEGLASTGGFSSVTRVDRYLESLAGGGDVIVIGEHRAKRYRLTNAGYTHAATLADNLAASVL